MSVFNSVRKMFNSLEDADVATPW